MPDLPRPPFKLRLARPYGTDDEFIASDAQWFGRASITLPHVAARPIGELVRFEIVLADGSPVLRGEGTVVANHPPGGVRPAGTEVRFTRIDARSKLILDRVRAFRASGSRATPSTPPASSRSTGTLSLRPSSLPSLLPSSAPAAPNAVASVPGLPGLAKAPLSPAASPSTPPARRSAPSVIADRPSDHSGVHRSHLERAVLPPPNREEILARLRERARHLQALQVQGTAPFKRRDVG